MPTSQYLFREFAYGSDAYRQECELRQRVLRTPLGMNLYDEDLTGEAAQLHFGLFDRDVLTASVIAAPISATEVKLRQMAVEPKLQGQGYGRTLLQRVEADLLTRGYGVASLHARITAVGFYAKLGFMRVGEEFLEIGLPHVKMQKHFDKTVGGRKMSGDLRWTLPGENKRTSWKD